MGRWSNTAAPLRGRRIQLRCAPSPPPCLGMFGWSAGGSVGLHASQLVNQRTSEEVNQSTNQLVSQSTNQKSTPKWTTSGPKPYQKSTKLGPTCEPKSIQNRSLRRSWELLGALGGGLGGSWGGLGGLGGHVGPKMGPRAQNPVRWTPLDPQVGSQNRAKIGPKPVQNAIFFLMGCWMGFKSILVPTWLQLGSQNHPKMEPSWLQKPSKRQSSKIKKNCKNRCFYW